MDAFRAAKLDVKLKVNRICDSFESDWIAGKQPDIEEFLKDTEGDFRTLLVEELEILDLEYRAKIPPNRIGRYEIERLLGEGGDGRVYLADDPTLNRKVAIKLPRLGSLDKQKSFLAEADKLVLLDHPNVVPVYDAGVTDDGVSYLVSKFINGNDLSTRMEEKAVTRDEALQVLAKISAAVTYIHSQGIVHRDIKPGNILVETNHKPYLADFGIARDTNASITEDGKIRGTLVYMSPEQAEGDSSKIDKRTDIYSLGIVLYEILCGKPPFIGSMYSLLDQIKNKLPQEPRKKDASIPQNLEAVCLKAISKDPGRRYQSALDFADDLNRAIEGSPVLARRAGIVEKAVWRIKRNTVVSVMSVVVVGLLALLGFSMIPSPVEPVMRETRTVTITTDPPGAKIVFIPLDENTGLPIKDEIVRTDQVTPVEVELKPGLYWIEAQIKGRGFHEVFRTVPDDPEDVSGGYKHLSWTMKEDGSIELPEIVIRKTVDVVKSLDEMTGGTASYGTPTMYAEVEPFWIAKRAVTVSEYRKSGFTFPFITVGDYGSPMSNVSWDDAVAYAESIGMRLPTIFEFFYADFEHYVAEWSMSWAEPRQDDWDKMPDERKDIYRLSRCFAGMVSRSLLSSVRSKRSVTIGFRCSRSFVPRFIID